MIKQKTPLLIITLLFLFSLVYAQSISIYNGASSTEINPKEQSEVIIKQGETLSINNIDYPAKQGSKFVFNEKGELTTGTSFTTKQTTYNIKGFEIDLPEDSIVTYYNDRITIRIKKTSKLSVKETENAKSDIPFEFISDGELEVDGIKIKSLENQETKVFYDTEKNLFYIKKAKINDFEIGNLESPNTYLFSTEIQKDFDKPALLIKDNKITLKSSSTEDSPDLTYKKDNAKSIMQALDGGQLEITTKGGYKIFNGKLLEKNTKIGKLSEKYYDLIEPTEKTIPLHITSFKEDGTPPKGETFYDNQGNFFVGYNQGDGIYKKSNGEIYVENNELKTSFQNLNSEQKTKFNELSGAEKLQLLRGVATGGNLKGVLDSISAIPDSVRKLSKIRNVNVGNPVIEEVASFIPREGYNQAWWANENNPGSKAHYATHQMHSTLRNKYGQGFNSAAMYIGEGEFVIIDNPQGITMRQLASHMSSQGLGGGAYNTYLVGSQSGWNNQPLTHMFDEWGAYIYTSSASSTASYNGGAHSTANMMNLAAYNVGMLDLVKSSQGETQYYQDLRNIVRVQLTNTESIYQKASSAGLGSSATSYRNKLQQSSSFQQSMNTHFGEGSFNKLF